MLVTAVPPHHPRSCATDRQIYPTNKTAVPKQKRPLTVKINRRKSRRLLDTPNWKKWPTTPKFSHDALPRRLQHKHLQQRRTAC
jgi:hypothetical protein